MPRYSESSGSRGSDWSATFSHSRSDSGASIHDFVPTNDPCAVASRALRNGSRSRNLAMARPIRSSAATSMMRLLRPRFAMYPTRSSRADIATGIGMVAKWKCCMSAAFSACSDWNRTESRPSRTPNSPDSTCRSAASNARRWRGHTSGCSIEYSAAPSPNRSSHSTADGASLLSFLSRSSSRSSYNSVMVSSGVLEGTHLPSFPRSMVTLNCPQNRAGPATPGGPPPGRDAPRCAPPSARPSTAGGLYTALPQRGMSAARTAAIRSRSRCCWRPPAAARSCSGSASGPAACFPSAAPVACGVGVACGVAVARVPRWRQLEWWRAVRAALARSRCRLRLRRHPPRQAGSPRSPDPVVVRS